MIDITKAKTDAEEGLRIAEFVTPDWRDEAGFNNAGCPTRFLFVPGNNLRTKVEMHAADSEWAVDSRTRAPEAYRNVIEMANAVTTLRAALEHVRALHDHMTKLYDAERAKVAAAELAEEKMTRKAEEHYDRAVKAEAERDALRVENERHLAQSWAFETEIEQLRAQLDKYAEVKPAKDLP
jgi:hypothetical protein